MCVPYTIATTYVVFRAVCIYVLVKELRRNATMCTNNWGKKLIHFLPTRGKIWKKFGSLFAPFSFKNCPNFEHLSLLFKLVHDP